MTLNMFCQPFGNLGIPNHTREFIRGIMANGVDVRMIPLMPKIAGGVTADYDLTPDLTKNMGKLDRNAPSICFWYPPVFEEVLGVYPKNIGYYIFEYDNIPQEWVDVMNTLDVVCTASQWGVDVLKKNGVTKPCKVIPGGVNSKVFYPLEKSESKNTILGAYQFIHVGKAEVRKGTLELLQAFNRTFKGSNDVRLILMVDNGNVSSEEFLKKYVDEGLFKYPTDNIVPLSFVDDIAEIYRDSDCGVFPSKAEGIGLPITEAMACGLPVIVSKNSGMTEYITEKNAIVLTEGTASKIYDPKYFPVAGERGTWTTPSIEEIGAKMRWAFENQELASKIGQVAAEDMKKYSWEAAGKKFKEEVLDAP